MALIDRMPQGSVLHAAYVDGFRVFDGSDDYGSLTGARPDVLIVDGGSTQADRIDDIAITELFFARARRDVVRELFVNGRHVVADQRLRGIDFAGATRELIAQARAHRRNLTSTSDLAARREAIRRYYARDHDPD